MTKRQKFKTKRHLLPTLLLTLAALVLAGVTACRSNGNSFLMEAFAGNAENAESAIPADGVFRPSDSRIRYVGRFSFADPDAPRMGFTGAQIYANFTGTSVSMIMKPQSGFFTAVIDSGKPITLQSLADSVILIAKDLKAGQHSLAIYQCTEAADVDFPVFHGLKLDPGATLSEAPKLPERKIEFIGNSITCGKGALDTTKAKNRDDITFESWYVSYDAEIARRLNAQCMVVARSGIGIYRNNGDPKAGGLPTMKDYYSRCLLSEKSESWNFSNFTPDLVCINLGTNDTAQLYDVELYKQAAAEFLADVRSHYPHATLVVLTGPMRSGKRLVDQKAGLDYAVAQLKAKGDKAVYRIDVPADTGRFGYGTGYHPSVGEHQYMADFLTPQLQKIMGW